MSQNSISNSLNSWDLFYLDLAATYAKKSKDPSTKVGAVIVDSKSRPISQGYNGFARGVNDTADRLNNRELKYKMVVHAEVNAMIFAQRNLEGATLYTYPFMPCSNCAAIAINAGIQRCVSYINDNPRWVENFKITQQMFREANVSLALYPMKTPTKEEIAEAAKEVGRLIREDINNQDLRFFNCRKDTSFQDLSNSQINMDVINHDPQYANRNSTAQMDARDHQYQLLWDKALHNADYKGSQPPQGLL
jgi:dCMP deaminase